MDRKPPRADVTGTGGEFHAVIVGAGSAGCALADLLSRDPGYRVLLLEAGGWDSNPIIAAPMFAGTLMKRDLYNWGDVSEPDAALNGRRNLIPHGKVVGGSSSINYMAYTRGHPRDFNRWAEAGAQGWDYHNVLPFFRAIESWEGGPDAWRGGDGPVGVSQPRLTDDIASAWEESLRREGIPRSRDLNGDMPEGYAPIQYSARHGRRSSSGRTFLRTARKRPNLTVRVGSHVTRVLFRNGRAAGVEYRQGDQAWKAIASERVVLCLGAINTPHLLMLSGIGPADHLRKLGIAPRANLPVGQNLEDHLGFAMFWNRMGPPGAFHASLRADRVAVNVLRAHLCGTGPAATLPPVYMAYVRSRAGLTQPDLELLLHLPSPTADFWAPGIGTAREDAFGVKVYLTGQQSRGSVTLRSSDPMDRPVIRYNSLSHGDDLVRLRAGAKLALRIVEDPALDAFRGAPLYPPVMPSGDDEIDAFIRKHASQQYHPASTCPMGSGDHAVLGPDLAVRGVEGLYVCDASAMPHLVSGNPNAVIMMMAARAAALWSSAGSTESANDKRLHALA